jgi:N,N'-diacetyllegionaminate synthase
LEGVEDGCSIKENATNQMLIAEIGSVHDGSVGNAMKLIELASYCGADAVKFQTHIPEFETTVDAPSPAFFDSEDRYAYFKRTGFTLLQWSKLREKALEFNLRFISSPFSVEAVELLEAVGIDMYKVASGELTNLPLLESLNRLGKPVIVSTGMSNWQEIDASMGALCDVDDLTVMQCTSMYPCPSEFAGLNVINELQSRYPGINIGYSDHYDGMAAGVSAAALGAKIIEKHITFSRMMYGSDAQYALEPTEFKHYCHSVKEVWKMIQSPVDKDNLLPFMDMRKVFMKSIVAKKGLRRGSIIREEDLAFKKPATGMSPFSYRELLGKTVNRDINIDEEISPGDVK